MSRVLLNELFKGEVKVVQAPKMHLCLVKLILEIKTLLYVLKLNKGRNDLGLGKLLGSHHTCHIFDFIS